MTNEELLELKQMALEAQPFTDPVTERNNGSHKERKEANADFFLKAKDAMPALIDELIEWRKATTFLAVHGWFNDREEV